MLQQDSSFLFFSPTVYFGSFEQTEEEIYQEDICHLGEFYPLILEIHNKKSKPQPIGLYLHWGECFY